MAVLRMFMSPTMMTCRPCDSWDSTWRQGGVRTGDGRASGSASSRWEVDAVESKELHIADSRATFAVDIVKLGLIVRAERKGDVVGGETIGMSDGNTCSPVGVRRRSKERSRGFAVEAGMEGVVPRQAGQRARERVCGDPWHSKLIRGRRKGLGFPSSLRPASSAVRTSTAIRTLEADDAGSECASMSSKGRGDEKLRDPRDGRRPDHSTHPARRLASPVAGSTGRRELGERGRQSAHDVPRYDTHGQRGRR
jgi:hypothetical protein